MTLQITDREALVRDAAVRDAAVRAAPVPSTPVRADDGASRVPSPGPSRAPSHAPAASSPRGSVPPRAAGLFEALERARTCLRGAALVPGVPERYLAAHLGAQQVAGVVLAAKGARLGSGPCDPWDAIALVAPGCGEWAAYFAALQPKRRAVAAGVRAIVGEREADDLVRDALGFHDHVLASLQRCLAHRSPADPPRADHSAAPASEGEGRDGR